MTFWNKIFWVQLAARKNLTQVQRSSVIWILIKRSLKMNFRYGRNSHWIILTQFFTKILIKSQKWVNHNFALQEWIKVLNKIKIFDLLKMNWIKTIMINKQKWLKHLANSLQQQVLVPKMLWMYLLIFKIVINSKGRYASVSQWLSGIEI